MDSYYSEEDYELDCYIKKHGKGPGRLAKTIEKLDESISERCTTIEKKCDKCNNELQNIKKEMELIKNDIASTKQILQDMFDFQIGKKSFEENAQLQ